ncbi:Peptidase propeptide and YPEB domain-containing protein [Streptomyces sp. 1222.5]|nr:peptidase YpeB-like protein [Streptomyces sp. 5112.2]SEB61651.1 Peptidase propeptide and YPEB domain-containing protein [Streptomyces sp. 1222.5]
MVVGVGTAHTVPHSSRASSGGSSEKGDFLMRARSHTPAGRRRTVATVLAATVVLGGAGAATAVAFAEDGDHRGLETAAAGSAGTDRDDHGDHGSDRTIVKAGKVDLKQAVADATRSTAGTVTEIELDDSLSKPVWKAEVVDARGTEREFTVDATDGMVTATATAKDDDSDDDAALAKSAGTDVTRAVDAALARIKGTATAAELEGEHGTPVWHVDVTDAKGRDHEVTVGARSGKVTASEADDHHRHGDSDDRDDD